MVSESYCEQPVVIKTAIPSALKLQFKVLCTQKDLNMSRILEQLIRHWLQAEVSNLEFTIHAAKQGSEEVKGYIPKSLKRQFKVLCTQKQIRMGAVLHHLIEEWVQTGGPIR